MGADMNAVRDFKKKAVPEQIENFRKLYESSSSEGKQELIDLNKPQCDEWAKTDSYNDKESTGYGVCCDGLGLCGMSGWIIFLIIFIILLCLAGAAAAFYFFYYKRKMGGSDQEEIESADTVNSKHDISVDSY
ncbi:hypothetical protein CRE_28846 [Caenorhabditis remanei]|uniref:Uncharacterized protein n=1 Tax=Caenorhabditis remanei TaxID=31234 RepID=E3MXD8_CAERE|nr:hypothetical protein CRE_28846 [Caenorhabditis remanei]